MQQFREMSTERTKAYRSTIGFGVVVLTLGKFQIKQALNLVSSFINSCEITQLPN